jgi:hypothetical protein
MLTFYTWKKYPYYKGKSKRNFTSMNGEETFKVVGKKKLLKFSYFEKLLTYILYQYIYRARIVVHNFIIRNN